MAEGVVSMRAQLVDASGNVFVAGYLVFGSTNDPGGFVLLKYDPSGALLWSDVFPVTWGETVRVETDAAGNAYLTGKGWLSGSATYVDYLTLKYAPDGTRLWLRAHGVDVATDVPASLAVSGDGRVAVTGSPSSGSPMVTVVYDTDGNVLWSEAAPAGRARDVVFGPNGEVYVVWASIGPIDVDFFKIRKSTNAGSIFGAPVTIPSGGVPARHGVQLLSTRSLSMAFLGCSRAG